MAVRVPLPHGFLAVFLWQTVLSSLAAWPNSTRARVESRGYRARPDSFAAGSARHNGPEFIWTAENMRKHQSELGFPTARPSGHQGRLLNGHLDATAFELFLHNQGNAFRPWKNEASETQGMSRWRPKVKAAERGS